MSASTAEETKKDINSEDETDEDVSDHIYPPYGKHLSRQSRPS